MSDEIHSAVKTYARANKLTMNEVYGDAVKWFLRKKEKGAKLSYLPSGKGHKYRSFWLETNILAEAKETAHLDDMSVNRVIYSAVVHYLRSKKHL